MSYLHCHTNNCGWSQDDFWSFKIRFRWKSYKESWWKLGFDIGYNPISKIFNDMSWLWKPRWISLDTWIIDDITKYTETKVKVRSIKKKKLVPKFININNKTELFDNYFIEHQVFSWQWLYIELIKEWKIFCEMKWKTFKSWKKARDTAVCPKCGERNFDID